MSSDRTFQPQAKRPLDQHEQWQAHRRQRAYRLGVEMLEVGDLADKIAKLEEEKRNGGGGGGDGLPPAEKLVCIRAAIRKLLKADWGKGEDLVLTTRQEWE